MESVPRFIGCFLLNHLEDNMKLDLQEGFRNEVDTQEIFIEPSDVSTRRLFLLDELAKLEGAMKVLRKPFCV